LKNSLIGRFFGFYINSFTEKEESFENTVSKKLISFQEGLQAMDRDRNMNNTEALEKGQLMQELERCVKEGLEDVRNNNAKCGGLEKKFDNFRNEMNTLFIDYENTWNERFRENAHALDSLRKTKGKPV
jgi:predicted  nucleic acid-binding Zn-ribbon protein